MTEQQTIDLNQPLTDCLNGSEQYDQAYELWLELQDKAKRAEMGFSFGEYEKVNQFDNDAVEAARTGKLDEDKHLLMRGRDVTARKIVLYQKAANKQEGIVKQLAIELRKEAAPQYDGVFGELFDELIDAGEAFHNAVLKILKLQNRIVSEANVPENFWPPRWHIGQQLLERLDVHALDGQGLFRTRLNQIIRNWDNAEV
jgi:hypothetical protein